MVEELVGDQADVDRLLASGRNYKITRYKKMCFRFNQQEKNLGSSWVIRLRPSGREKKSSSL